MILRLDGLNIDNSIFKLKGVLTESKKIRDPITINDMMGFGNHLINTFRKKTSSSIDPKDELFNQILKSIFVS